MGNLTSPKFPEDKIPGGGVLHPEGLILGGLPRPTASGNLNSLVNRHPADIDVVPYTVSDGAGLSITLPTFGNGNRADALCEGSDSQIVGRAALNALSRLNPARGEVKNVLPYTENFARVVDPGTIDTQGWSRSPSVHGDALESPAIPRASDFRVKMYDDPQRGNILAVTPPTWSWRHIASVPGFLFGSPVNAGFARQYLDCPVK